MIYEDKTYDIGIIIINYNTSKHTINCIKSIEKYTSKNISYKIVVIDNNSSLEDFKNLSDFHFKSRFDLIRNRYNYGFSTANMIALNSVKSKYYFFLNNDAELLNDCCSILMSYMDKFTNVGIASGQVYKKDGSIGINFNYLPDLKLKLLGSGLLRLIWPSEYPKKGVAYLNPTKVQVINGSSMFIRSNIFNDLGGFDTIFFLYCEEEDIAIRMRKKGYSCYLIPGAKYTHIQGASSTVKSESYFKYLKEFYISQNFLYLKHFGFIANIIWRVTQFFRMARKVFINYKYFHLGIFILFNTGMKNSLRGNEKISP